MGNVEMKTDEYTLKVNLDLDKFPDMVKKHLSNEQEVQNQGQKTTGSKWFQKKKKEEDVQEKMKKLEQKQVQLTNEIQNLKSNQVPGTKITEENLQKFEENLISIQEKIEQKDKIQIKDFQGILYDLSQNVQSLKSEIKNQNLGFSQRISNIENAVFGLKKEKNVTRSEKKLKTTPEKISDLKNFFKPNSKKKNSFLPQNQKIEQPPPMIGKEIPEEKIVKTEKKIRQKISHQIVVGNHSCEDTLIAFHSNCCNHFIISSAFSGLNTYKKGKNIWNKEGSYWDIKHIDNLFWAYEYQKGKIEIYDPDSSLNYPFYFFQTEKENSFNGWGKTINKMENEKYLILMFRENLFLIELLQPKIQKNLDLKIPWKEFGRGEFCKVIPLRNSKFLVLTRDCHVTFIQAGNSEGKLYYDVIQDIDVKKSEEISEYSQNFEICDKEKFIFVALSEGFSDRSKCTSISVFEVGERIELVNVLDLTSVENYAVYCLSFCRYFDQKIVICGGFAYEDYDVDCYVFDTETMVLECLEGARGNVGDYCGRLERCSDGVLRGFCYDNSVVEIEVFEDEEMGV